MKTRKAKISILLLLALLLSVVTPAIPAEAAEDPYLAFQTAWDGSPVNRMDSNLAKRYKVEKLLLRPGDKQDLCFINAGSWKDSSWKSSDTKVAKVDSKGNVTAVSDGVATITLTYKKKITNKKVTVKAKVYVGEKNWGLDAGITKDFLDIETLEMKVGGDFDINVYGLPVPDDTYSIDMTSSDKKVAECFGQSLYARKAGTAVVTVQVKNSVTGVVWTKKFNVKVTNAVTVSNKPEDKYFAMYGEDYIRMFKNGGLLATIEAEKDLMDTAVVELEKHEAFMGLSAANELVNPFDNIKKIFTMLLRGKDYMYDDLRMESVTYLIQQITQDTQNEAFLAAKQETLNKILELRKTYKNVSQVLNVVSTGEIGGGEEEFDSLVNFLLNAKLGDHDDLGEKGLTATDYMITTLCLYELDVELMNMLQACSNPGEELYEDIELLQKARKKDPGKYYLGKYGPDIAADIVSDILKSALGGEIAFAVKAMDMFFDMTADIAGARELSELFKTGRTYMYLADMNATAYDIWSNLSKNGNSYSDAELVEMIKQYEFAYSSFLSMIEPTFDLIQKLDPMTINYDLSKDSLAVANGYDYNRHVAMAMALYYDRFGATNTPAKLETESLPEPQWSEWQSTLPAYVNNNYMIEERTLYRFKQLETTTGTTNTLTGWELYDKASAGEQYGAWSAWSTNQVSAKTNRQVDSKTQYSYRTKYTQAGYSDWSAWQMEPIAQSGNTEVETRPVYGYYYYYCTNCGAHMHGYGTNGCYTWAGGCGASIPAANAVSFFNESPHSVGLGDWHGTGKYYKIINNELVFKWEDYATLEYRSRNRIEGNETVYSEWSEYSDTSVVADAAKEVRTRTVYRYRDKTNSTVYYFRRWSDWSAFSTSPVAASETCMVETKKEYRFKAK